MISQYALITLEEVREYPGMSGISTADDAILEALIDSVSMEIEAFCGNVFVIRQFSEDHTWDEICRSPNRDKIWMQRYPIVSVLSMCDQKGNAIPSTDYWLDKNVGCLRTSGSWNIPQDSNGFATYWTILYTAGRYANTAAVPANLKLAAKMHMTGRYKRPDSTVRSKTVGELSITYADTSAADGDQPTGFDATVRALIAPYRSRLV